MSRLSRLSMIFTLLTLAAAGQAGHLGFEEDYALSGDRETTLKQLIPGTQEYYYYHCLHYQTTGQLDKVEPLLKAWIARYHRTDLAKQIERRQALLNYGDLPEDTLQFLRNDLNLHFNHQRETQQRNRQLPTELDADLISRETLTRRALARHSRTVAGFSDKAFPWLLDRQLSQERLHHLLTRLDTPDHPKLAQRVLSDLDYRYSRGFGSLKIHRLLTRAQLDELLKAKRSLATSQAFVQTYVSKLAPGEDVNWREDLKARQAYYARVWDFLDDLPPVHNTLKACVLYQWLQLDRQMGRYNHDRFMAYIRLPRSVYYIDPDYLKRDENRRYQVSMNSGFQQIGPLPPIGGDVDLVTDYLRHFFLDGQRKSTWKTYATYMREDFLKKVYAESLLTAGKGDPEDLRNLLTEQQLKALRDRVDLEFDPANTEYFGPDEKVQLAIHVKNVEKLIVKVYEISPLNYARQKGENVDPRVDLEGLVANTEKVYGKELLKDAAANPMLRRAYTFGQEQLPALARRGSFIVEFIGGGKSSRALINRGKLSVLARKSTAGLVCTVLDETGKQVEDARIYLGSKEYTADDNGRVLLPFTNQSGSKKVVLYDGQVATVTHVELPRERYALRANFHVDRENLLAGREAKVLVRTDLLLDGVPVTLSVLNDVKLKIITNRPDNMRATETIDDFKLHEDRESIHTFRVPDDLREIRFELTATVRRISDGQKMELSDEQTFHLNDIDRTEKVEDLHLMNRGGTWTIELRGKTGEGRPDRPVQVQLNHAEFTESVHVTLRTDSQGRITLGELDGITTIAVTGPEGTSHTWTLPVEQWVSGQYPGSQFADVHGRAGEAIRLPFFGGKEVTRSDVALLEMRNGTPVADRFDAIKASGGMLVIDDLPAGDYRFIDKRVGKEFRIRLTEGDKQFGRVMGDPRRLELQNTTPLQIASVEAGDENVRIRVLNAGKAARVHVIATRYLPAYQPLDLLGRLSVPDPQVDTFYAPRSEYLSGRQIGDELQYILARRYLEKFPGVMLTDPSLLLNPWALRDTETSRQTGKLGEDWGKRSEGAERGPADTGAWADDEGGDLDDLTSTTNLDFLAETSVVLANLAVDEDGTITVARKALGDRQHIHIVAMDARNAVYRTLALPEPDDVAFLDLRLMDGLDPDGHFTQQKLITPIAAGKTLTIENMKTARMETYDSLEKVFRLYQALTEDPTLDEFAWIVRWPELSEEQKREKYSEYACHELHFFLSRKDPKFFADVVKPYLANKKDKTFLDHYLLGDNLADYRKPWAFSRLNAVERVLLADRIDSERQAIAGHIADLAELSPLSPDEQDRLFEIAIRGLGLSREAFESAGMAAGQGGQQGQDQSRRRYRADRGIASQMKEKSEAAAMETPATKADADEADGYAFQKDDKLRDRATRLYRKLEKTREWAENNYYHLPIEQHVYQRVAASAFWADFASRDRGQAFLSPTFARAKSNFTEVMLALSVLDLPFRAPSGEKAHDVTRKDAALTFRAAGNLVAFHEEIRPAEMGDDPPAVLVSQDFFRHGDRYRYVDGEKHDKFVDEFLPHVVYGCQVVVTNPNAARQKMDVLLQIPRGAIPVLDGRETRTVSVDVQPYGTQKLEYYFYFPATGEWRHFPVHVSKNEKLVKAAEPATLKVVKELSKVDKTSWDYISQHGSEEDVFDFLKQANLFRVDLTKTAWRMNESDGGKAFFRRAIEILRQRHVYNDVLWSYGIKHNDPQAISQYLRHQQQFVAGCGWALDSPLLTIDPIERRTYQHLEYKPLVNARAHQLGQQRSIVNEAFYRQYQRLLSVLTYQAGWSTDQKLALTYYLLLQGRVSEAKKFFARVKPESVEEKLQHDYLLAYMDFYNVEGELATARKLADKYKDYPVDRWRKRFAEVASQIAEIEGGEGKVVDPEDRTQTQTNLASSQPALDLTVEAGKVKLAYQNVGTVRVNYYEMDIELLFSRQPFSGQFASQFSLIKPNATASVDLPEGKDSVTFDLPEQFRSANVLVEVTGGGATASETYYANDLNVQVIDAYGQVKVTHSETGRAMPKVYVKVYARMKGGKVQFYKDGYTDLRGRFDYTSLNTDELDHVEEFAILVLSERDGAVIREADPPTR